MGGIAAFMLGIPSTVSLLETRSNYDARINSHSAFVHDDWRVSDRLTLNLGLRYDLELGLTEVENRNIGGFDLTTTNPIEAQARANFAANPPWRPDNRIGVQRARRLPPIYPAKVGVEHRHGQLPAARVHLQAVGQVRAPREAGSSSAVQIQGCRASLRA
jgi:hypothetical protein